MCGWVPVAFTDTPWLGLDPTTGLTGTGVYILADPCTFLADEHGNLLIARTG